jgi:amino acid adenylation domain-containing protein
LGVPAGWTRIGDFATRRDALENLACLGRKTCPLSFARNQHDLDLSERYCVHNLIERQAALTPSAPAVLCGNTVIRYRDLDTQANQVASVLRREHAVGPEVLVGLLFERSVQLIVALVGVLKAGGAYVALDPAHPPERNRTISSDARLRLILTDGTAQLPSVDGVESVRLQSVLNGDSRDDQKSLASGVHPNNVAAVLYTSGSTGAPKGVVMSHRAIVWRIETGYPLRSGDLQRASLTVVGHFSDVLAPLAQGGVVRLVGDAAIRDTNLLTAELWRQGTSRLVAVPSQLRIILESGRDVLRRMRRVDTVIVGGERVTPSLVQAFYKGMPWAQLWNGYGTTELASFIALGEVQDGERVTVGRPCRGSEVHILDHDLEPVASGVSGEVYVTGEHLSRGYLNDPGLTAQRYVASPFSPSGARLYRTGDVGRWLDDGAMELVGRVTGLVKVRGRRLHLSEVEAAIESHPGVAVAIVHLEATDAGDRLVAHIQRVSGADARLTDSRAIREHLRTRLPESMIPTRIRVESDELPTLVSGKIDQGRIANETVLE